MKYMVCVREKSHQSFCRLLGGILVLLPMICISMACISFADDNGVSVIGKVYEFADNNPYKISEANESGDFRRSDDAKTYGLFSIVGDGMYTSDSSFEDIPSYSVDGNKLSFSYTYNDALLKAEKGSWQLYEDDCETIDGIDLDEDIDKGAIVIQTSRDRQKWITNTIYTNVFENTPVQTEPFYEASTVMIDNGSYFRVIVAYETRKFLEKAADFLFIPGEEKYEYKRHAEVYEFYAFNANSTETSEGLEKYYFTIKNRTVNTGNNTGYSGADSIDSDDPHYGWEIGDFFVSGYTQTTIDKETGNIVFLKTPGDKVTLWFSLAQDIDQLNGDEDLCICQDDGFDQAFGTKKTDFGRGTVLIRYTDYENKQHKPVLFTNYFDAVASPGADTKVTLFEEGDYEVALDYEIEESTGIPIDPFHYNDYRAYIRFSIRNGNCMVYPFDIETGRELKNRDVTEKGFYLDLARSRYLDLSIKKEVLGSGEDGLVEDIRFNGSAKEGKEYTDEGIYTIEAYNKYTGKTTPKKIYVGKNNVLKASVMNDLTVEEVNAKIEDGAEITDEGMILSDSGEDTETEKAIESSEEPEPETSIVVPFFDISNENNDPVA